MKTESTPKLADAVAAVKTPGTSLTNLLVASVLGFFFAVVGLASLGVFLVILTDPGFKREKSAEHLLALHTTAGHCISVMLIAVFLPADLSCTMGKMAPPTRHNSFVVRKLLKWFDFNKNGELEWFDVLTGLAVAFYGLALSASLWCLFATGFPMSLRIHLAAGMIRPISTILVKGYFSPPPTCPCDKPKAARNKLLEWLDVNHDGEFTKIDLLCGLTVLVYVVLQTSNILQSLMFPCTRELRDELIQLPLLVVTMAALALFAPSRANVLVFQIVAIGYFLLALWFVVRMIFGLEVAEAGGWLDCVLKVASGIAAAIMNLVATFLAKKYVSTPPAKISAPAKVSPKSSPVSPLSSPGKDPSRKKRE